MRLRCKKIGKKSCNHVEDGKHDHNGSQKIVPGFQFANIQFNWEQFGIFGKGS